MRKVDLWSIFCSKKICKSAFHSKSQCRLERTFFTYVHKDGGMDFRLGRPCIILPVPMPIYPIKNIVHALKFWVGPGLPGSAAPVRTYTQAVGITVCSIMQ